MTISEYFNNSEICLKNKGLLFYNRMATIWYGSCGLLNLNYKDFITKISECNKTLLFASKEIIKIDKSPLI